MNKLSEIFDIEPFDSNISLEDYGSHEYNPKILREEAIKRNSEIVQCTNCGVSGNRPNMMRWHFENCKTVLRTCKQCNNTIPRQGVKDYLYKQKDYCNQDCYAASKAGKNPIQLTDEMKRKIGEKNSKKLMVDGVLYKSRTEMSKTHRISGRTFKEWVDSGRITYIED